MSNADWIQVGFTFILVVVGAIGWLRDRNKESHCEGEDEGSTKTQVKSLELNMTSGFQSINQRMDRFEDRLNGIMNGRVK